MNTGMNMGSSDSDWWDELSPEGRQSYIEAHPNSHRNPNRPANSNSLARVAQLVPTSFHDKMDSLTGGLWKKSGNAINIAANALDGWERKWGELKQDDPRLADFLEFTFKMVAAAGLAAVLGL
jgi:hypothetical protein